MSSDKSQQEMHTESCKKLSILIKEIFPLKNEKSSEKIMQKVWNFFMKLSLNQHDLIEIPQPINPRESCVKIKCFINTFNAP